MAGRFGMVAIAAACCLFAQPALAQQRPANSIDGTAIISSLGPDAVMPALAVATANQLVEARPDGTPFISATAMNGLVMQISFTSCDEGGQTGCLGMSIVSVWTAAEPEVQAQIAAAVRGFLIDHPLANAGQFDDGTPYFSRYVIADYGIAQGNLLSEFSNFVSGATDFHNMLAGIDGGLGAMPSS
ncbi:hypothetical protein GRI62_04490 [Erythrobacter arachoides]|uniref:YbjN domain-containing protein n=1 Tax=Aurantiacibacter arachoides TaxID=1850444 RepID=A0A845A162_9SPHN|nr:hypothetical protein [Aurantiacibacter arachoides]MXO92866.1 hypothetical protein [Aurantiacibacter arachoides]GGD53851.1 hypothetical protein GCM10011411_12200 [Aurantiacibacter arachoides]